MVYGVCCSGALRPLATDVTGRRSRRRPPTTQTARAAFLLSSLVPLAARDTLLQFPTIHVLFQADWCGALVTWITASSTQDC